MSLRMLKTLMLCVVFAISACNEGESGVHDPAGGIFSDSVPGESVESDPANGNVDDNTPTINNAFNGGLSGTLITGHLNDSTPSRYGLTTGQYVKTDFFSLPNMFARENQRIASTKNFIAYNRTAPGLGYVQTFPECFKIELAFRQSCVVVVAADGSFRSIQRLGGESLSAAKLSPDGRYIVLNNFYDGYPSDSYIQIRTVSRSDPELVHELKLLPSTYTDDQAVVEWGASGEVFYTDSADEISTVYVTAPYTLDTVQSIKLTGYTGEVGSLDISPDGRKLLIGWANGGILVLDLETLDMRVPAVGDDYIRNAAWSPDGQWILVMFGGNYRPPGYINPYDIPAPPEPSGRAVVRMFAVPADGERTELGMVAEDISPRAILLFNYIDDPEYLTDKWIGGKVFWLE